MPKKGGKRERATLRWDADSYTPDILAGKSDKEIRAEYSRLRGIAEKRIAALGRNDRYSTYKVYTTNVGKYKPLKEMSSRAELVHSLSELSRFIGAKTSSVTGLNAARDKWVESMREKGYDWITKENAYEVGDFFEDWRAKGNAKIYDSERSLSAFNVSQSFGVSSEDLFKHFLFWSRNAKEIEEMQIPEDKRPHSSTEVAKLLYKKREKAKKQSSKKGKRK